MASNSTVVAELNRLANGGTYPSPTYMLDEAGAANRWAGTSGLEMVGALNVVAGNVMPAWIDAQGAANQIAGTSGLGIVEALAQIGFGEGAFGDGGFGDAPYGS